MRPRLSTVLMLAAAAGGLFFASFSTYDFVQHLDRQVHGIHCSFIPGLSGTDVSGSSGCQVTLMSPYSSVFRSMVWGGIPVSLGAMGVFAFLLFRSLDLALNRREDEKGTSTFLVAAWGLPLLTSIFMGYIAFAQLDAACKLCIGIYTSSILGFAGSVWARMNAGKADGLAPLGFAIPQAEVAEDEGVKGHILGFLQGVGFVSILTLLYLVLQPDQSKYVGECGSLLKPDDPYGVMVPLSERPGGIPTIEVFDPLCPSCKGTEARLEASGLEEKLNRKLVLFPLDSTCNWMVTNTIHPGACTVSEAVLCAGDKADIVIDWAFQNQTAIREASTADANAAAKMVGEKFPDLKSCLGSANAKQKLNKSLRWIVSNQLEVLTPQIFVDGTKLCDEDTDLGMDYALTRLLEKREKGELKPTSVGATR